MKKKRNRGSKLSTKNNKRSSSNGDNHPGVCVRTTTIHRTPWVSHEEHHDARCRQDIMYRLLFCSDATSDLLASHVNGLISVDESSSEQGILLSVYGKSAWSECMISTLLTLKKFQNDQRFSQCAYHAYTRMLYHAVIFICIPHIANFAQYIVSHSHHAERTVHFVEHVLLPSEHAFFYDGCETIQTLAHWVEFLRNRWFIHCGT